jgi:hypothetical protein
MKALLICPAEGAPVAALAGRSPLAPLALWPFLGQPVLGHALAFLAGAGAREIFVLAADRPEAVRACTGRGEAWGVRVEVIPESRELTPAQARAKYQPGGAAGWLPAPLDVVSLGALPQLPGRPLWESYAGWQAALLAWLPAGAQVKVGMRELAPGVYVGRRARVAASATLHPPCWVGEHAWVGPGAVVGPETVIEDEVYVDQGAEVVRSVVGPRTYVGALTEVRDSLAWGRVLLKLTTGSHTEVTDPFLLGEWGAATARGHASHLAGRVAALLALGLTSPLVLWAWGRNRGSGRPLFERRVAVGSGSRPAGGGIVYYELGGCAGRGRRWPQLWSIVRGDFRWVGNRPLTAAQAAQLEGEFERLWLAAPTGLFCLADTLGSGEEFDEEARSHASFYAVDPDPRKNWRILRRALWGRRARA